MLYPIILLLYLHIYYTIYTPICINEREREHIRGSRWSYRCACKGNSRILHGGALKLAERLASETPGCPWEQLGESMRSLRGVVLRALQGTPAKIKERESKESQVEKKIKR